MGRSLNPTLNGCRLAQMYRVGSVTYSEMMFWFEYGQIISFLNDFLMFTRNVLDSLFSITYMCITKHLFNIYILYLMMISNKT